MPGLGESEAFYSWLLFSYNLGSVAAAIMFAVMERSMVPYWYMLLVNILAHIIGFLIRAITYQPALIVVSSFFAGYFPGGNYTIALTYIAKSVVEYEKLLKLESGDEANGKGASVRNKFFALFMVFANLGKIVGNGKLIHTVQALLIIGVPLCIL